MKILRMLRKLFAAMLSLALLTGCVQVATIPSMARSGDTIVLGLGGIKRNWQGESPKNLQIIITDSALNSYNLVPISFFQAYPDYRSFLNTSSLSPSLNAVKLEPYDGGWFVSTALVDNNQQPLSLATGTASVAITATNLSVVFDDQGQPMPQEGNLAEIPVEIIAGPPSNTDSSAQFQAYDNRGSHFLVRPATTPSTSVGGVYYVVNYQSDVDFDPGFMPAVYPVSHNPYLKINYTIKKDSNGSGSYHIYLYNSAGFVATASRQQKQASLKDLGVHIEYFDPDISAAQKTNFTVDTVKSYFVDINGNKIIGLQPEMLHSSDL
jgi:hypothetical protein